MGTMRLRAMSTSSGCSMRHEAHQDAQTFSIHTLPFMSCGVKASLGWCSCSRRKGGAGLSMKGEGTVRGSRVSPIAKKIASARNTPSGMMYLSAFTNLCPRGGGARRRRGRPARAVAPVGEREEAAERHQEGAAPDPVHERLAVDAHAPRAVADGLAQRDVEVTQEARIDVGLGHGLPRGV